MSSNKTKTDVKDRTQIDANEPYEVQYWSAKLNVSPQELKDAIKQSGTENVKKLEEFLRVRNK